MAKGTVTLGTGWLRVIRREWYGRKGKVLCLESVEGTTIPADTVEGLVEVDEGDEVKITVYARRATGEAP